MSMRNEQSTGRDPIDALIDSAAREMMGGEPSASLRSAVRHRIERRRPMWSLVPAWGVAASVAVAALFVGWALLGPSGAPDPTRPIAQPAIERAAIPVEQPPPVVAPDTGSVRSPWQAGQEPVPLTRRVADDVAALPQEEESLIPPIAIAALEPGQIAVGNPIAVESSGVMPIEIEPLQLEPLRGIE
jgi:hypothetical protein